MNLREVGRRLLTKDQGGGFIDIFGNDTWSQNRDQGIYFLAEDIDYARGGKGISIRNESVV